MLPGGGTFEAPVSVDGLRLLGLEGEGDESGEEHARTERAGGVPSAEDEAQGEAAQGKGDAEDSKGPEVHLCEGAGGKGTGDSVLGDRSRKVRPRIDESRRSNRDDPNCSKVNCIDGAQE